MQVWVYKGLRIHFYMHFTEPNDVSREASPNRLTRGSGPVGGFAPRVPIISSLTVYAHFIPSAVHVP